MNTANNHERKTRINTVDWEEDWLEIMQEIQIWLLYSGSYHVTSGTAEV